MEGLSVSGIKVWIVIEENGGRKRFLKRTVSER